jgi:uncharacterized protein YukE
MATVGGDVPAMFAFANELRRRRAAIEATTRRLGQLVEQANWVGPDRDSFVREWQGNHAPSLMSIMEDIADAANRIARQAQQQEQASR